MGFGYQMSVGLAMFVTLLSCRSKIEVTMTNSPDQPTIDVGTAPDIDIEKMNHLAAKPGEVVKVSGRNFRPGMSVLIGGVRVELYVESSTSASFVMPQTSVGLADVVFELESR